MKTYRFAPIAAREYPTLCLLDNPYVWGGVGFCLNVSEKPYPPEILEALKEKGIEWRHIPVSETDFSVSWGGPLHYGIRELAEAHSDGRRSSSTATSETTVSIRTNLQVYNESRGSP